MWRKKKGKHDYRDLIFIFSDFFKIPPNHPFIMEMPLSLFNWTLMKIIEKKREEFKEKETILKTLCSFINPELAKHIFKERKVIVSSTFYDELREKLKKEEKDEKKVEEILEQIMKGELGFAELEEGL